MFEGMDSVGVALGAIGSSIGIGGFGAASGTSPTVPVLTLLGGEAACCGGENCTL